ncbi:hypothetical protein [Tannerella forsythia]|uniref:Uncharacterized protein n=1 Tax=Tannerella forsythia TaxID=28112 RepID=A0A3P1YX33_TANFO|nr:hypothetical protein [Tannerella forsythia]RRD75258.1 hypothetical protein EII41_07030 [Tannerella forsythia]
MELLQKRSDAKFRISISDSDGRPVDPKKCDLRFDFYTSKARRVRVERKAEEPLPPGMSFDGNQIIIALDAPNFAEGALYVRFRTRVHDPAFPDRFYDISSNEIKTNIVVVD